MSDKSFWINLAFPSYVLYIRVLWNRIKSLHCNVWVIILVVCRKQRLFLSIIVSFNIIVYLFFLISPATQHSRTSAFSYRLWINISVSQEVFLQSLVLWVFPMQFLLHLRNFVYFSCVKQFILLSLFRVSTDVFSILSYLILIHFHTSDCCFHCDARDIL